MSCCCRNWLDSEDSDGAASPANHRLTRSIFSPSQSGQERRGCEATVCSSRAQPAAVCLQFGRIPGIALMVLGIILIAIEAMIIAPTTPAGAAREATTKTVETKTSYGPGI